ncbi:MAG: beta-galactosidase [Candidatus Fimadaptatus sp.]|jgi:beta-galactosidase
MAEWKFPVFGHGGDYNPDQWLDNEHVLEEDVRLMKLSHCNIMSVGIFAWAALEPEEGVYNFDWLERVINRLYANGISVLLATPSGARPAWMSQRYPEVLRVREDGHRNTHGSRHNHCYTSPTYRMKVHQMNTKLAERFGKHPGVVGWHISNEFEGVCYCDLCKNAFRDFLKREYGSLDELNRCWWTSFWAHTYTDWSQIDPPTKYGENAVMALNLAWARFITYQTVDFMKNEVEPLRRLTPDLPVTANFMNRYIGLDYFKFKDVIDFASWDNYPLWGRDKGSDAEVARNTAFYHDCIRSILQKPWVLMESTPSATNWQEVCKLKRPGMHLLSSMLAVAHGADSVQYFQWRKSRGSSEKLHGAVVDHVGHEHTRVFRDVTDVGEYLMDIKPALHSMTHAKAALIYDWENRWAIESAEGIRRDKKHDALVDDHYYGLKSQGIDVDVIDSDQSLDKYSLVVAPMLYMIKPGVPERLEEFVKRGGQLVMTYMSGVADENDLCFLGGWPGPLKDLMGIWVEETDGLWDYDSNSIVAEDGNEMGITGSYECNTACDLMHANTARVQAVYGDDFYKGTPAVTVNDFGEGQAWYIASRVDRAFLKQFYASRVAKLGMPTLAREIPDGVLSASRDGEDGAKYIFYMNFDHETRTVVPLEGCRDLLTGEEITGPIELKPLTGATLVRK